MNVPEIEGLRVISPFHVSQHKTRSANMHMQILMIFDQNVAWRAEFHTDTTVYGRQFFLVMFELDETSNEHWLPVWDSTEFPEDSTERWYQDGKEWVAHTRFAGHLRRGDDQIIHNTWRSLYTDPVKTLLRLKVGRVI